MVASVCVYQDVVGIQDAEPYYVYILTNGRYWRQNKAVLPLSYIYALTPCTRSVIYFSFTRSS